jgi:hypothetical protein
MAGTDRDDEGFPPCGPDNELDTYTDEFEVTYLCEHVAGLGWGWRQIGRSRRPVDGRPD